MSAESSNLCCSSACVYASHLLFPFAIPYANPLKIPRILFAIVYMVRVKPESSLPPFPVSQ